jgi:hydrophobe/amphiphile efflux-1 (HAE1) family protein
MISHFFIDRPVFACVISIIIVLAGLASLRVLPIEQYPNITPPQIQVTATYTGADAKTVADTVAAPIEQQVNGVEDMIYMYSQNAASGALSLSVFFNIGADPDLAQINVQNRVSLAMPQLPPEVKQTGVNVQKQTPTILLLVAVESHDGRYDDVFTSNYTTINIVNELLREPGISSVSIIGARNYSMRVWLRPDRMAQLKITADDVITAIQQQNNQYGIGLLGYPPTSRPVPITIPVTSQGRFEDPEDYNNIILRAENDGSMVQIKDIGHVDLGAQDYSVIGELNSKNTTLIAIYQEFGANALDVAEETKKKMELLSKNFPKGITYSIPYDTTRFVKASIHEVVMTILEAAVLVTLVVLVFLQSMRATLIPLLAMTVSIVGTFTGMHLLGFSLNTLTLFGLVLAIGIVVDDAIVVVENVERNMHEFKLSPIDAARRAMTEVTGPVIAIVFVLCAVFIPVAFMGGIAGQLYKQFAITISISVVFSGIVALTLSPAIAALILKPDKKPNRLGRWFNTAFDKLTNIYTKSVRWMNAQAILGVIILIGVLCSLVYFFKTIPTSFVPNEDQGYLIAFANLPDGSSLPRTKAVDDKIYEITSKIPGFESLVSLTGFSFIESLNRLQIGTNFIVLKDWDQRTAVSEQAPAIFKKLQQEFYQVPDAQIIVFNPPAIQGLGTVGGFEFWIQNRGNGTLEDLGNVTQKFLEKARKRPELSALNSPFEINGIQLFANLDREKTSAYGVAIGDVYKTLQVLLGSVYINQFNKSGYTFWVTAQAEPEYRTSLDSLENMYVKSKKQEMIPLSSLMTLDYSKGPSLVSRFNGFNSAKINGNSAPGYSSGQALQAMQEVAKEVLPEDMSYAWSGQAYQELEAGGTSTSVMLAGLTMVFLILAALYERWSLPFAIILAVPFGLFGAFIAIWIRGMPNDVYFQIGLVTLIALSAKNAILIVEFAVLKMEEGLPIVEAAIEAAKLRFRAILMTSLTFILGVTPLVTSSGAGANSRHSVGTGVMGGMIAATFLAIFFVPLFFRLVEQYLVKEKQEEKKADAKP